MEPLDPSTPISCTLPAGEWNIVLSALQSIMQRMQNQLALSAAGAQPAPSPPPPPPDTTGLGGC